jgi:hypothetical protein
MARVALQPWLTTTLERVYPDTPAGSRSALRIDCARGERVSFQVALRNHTDTSAAVSLSLAGPKAFAPRIRRAGYVPLPHFNTPIVDREIEKYARAPGFVADPLFDENQVVSGGRETHAFWCNVTVPPDARPGKHTLQASVHEALADKTRLIKKLAITLNVHNVVLQPRRDFPVAQWFYADSLCDFYKVEPFEEKFWKIVKPYMQNLTDHGQDCIYVPVFTPPLDGVKRPTQLLKVRRAGGKYRFDWADVKRWVDTAHGCGIRHFEWTHFFTQWGVKHAIRIYEKKNGQDALLWEPDTAATSKTYRDFLSQFLPELKKFLEAENLEDRSFFHVSDEPHADHVPDYQAARQMLRELAPWMKTMDALSDIAFGRLGIVDLPIPSIKTALDFMAEKITCGAYYCCGPRKLFLNRLMDTPLAKIRMNGWLFHRFQPKLFLHWGYNYWHKSQTRELIDPFVVSDGMRWPGWAYGDTFCVYPGPNGPIDSIRWEVFAESMQDFALLQTVGLAPGSKALAALKSFSDFPKNAQWILRQRLKLLTAL